MAKFSGVFCGIKKEKKDLGLILVEDGSDVFGFFTSNKIKSEAIERAEKIIGGKPNKTIKGIYVISGNALCRYVGVEKDIQAMVKKFAEDIQKFSGKKLKTDQIIILSTGKIGVRIQLDSILQNSYKAIENLKDDVSDFSEAILTTDTKTKVSRFEKDEFFIVGVAKGAGMIFPDFSHATTLSFVITNSSLPKGFEKTAFDILQKTIGSVNIDSSQSTNDSCVFVFENKVKTDKKVLEAGVRKVLSDLAMYIAEDGEGVKHVVKLIVHGAKNDASARNISKSISFSFLFRSSIAGASPDFGRVLSAVGSSGEQMGKIKITVISQSGNKVVVAANSKVITENLDKAGMLMRESKYTIDVDVGLKKNGRYSMLMTDITEEYISINKTM